MMGLSAYGEPRFAAQVRGLVRTDRDQCRLNLAYFTHHSKGVDMTWYGGEPVLGSIFSKKMVEEFGGPRSSRSEIRQKDKDLAASVQSSVGGKLFRAFEFCPEANREDCGLPRGRRCLELRGQWNDI